MTRNASLDYARLIAAFGIVLFHSGAPGGAFGYVGLPFFLMLLLVLAWPAAQRTEFDVYVRGRAQRLLIPFVIWSLVYGALKLAEVLMTGKPPGQEFSASMLLTGPAIHLWFLPFAFVASVAVYPLAWLQGPLHVRVPKAVARRNRVVLVSVLTGLGLIALACRQGSGLPAPFAQWAYAAPAVCLGLVFAVTQGRAVTLILVIGIFTTIAMLAGWTDELVQLVLAALALLVCQMIRLPETALSRLSVAAAMGVYLCHPLVASVLERTSGLAPHSLGLAIATGAVALLLTLGIGSVQRYPVTLLFGSQSIRPILAPLLRRA